MNFESVKKLFEKIERAFLEKDIRLVEELFRYVYSQTISDFSQKAVLNLNAFDVAHKIGGSFFKVINLIQEYFLLKCKNLLKQAFETHLKVLDAILKCIGVMKEGLYEGNEWFKSLEICIRATKKTYISIIKEDESDRLLTATIEKLRSFRNEKYLNDGIIYQTKKLSAVQQMSISLFVHDYNNVNSILAGQHSDKEENYYFDNFMFLKGKHELINQSFATADACFEKIRINTASQRRLVLKYQIPCRLCFGKVFHCKKGVDYFPEYEAISKAITTANFTVFEQVNKKYEMVWLKRGIYLLMDQLRILVWRNLLKRLQLINESTISLEVIEKAAKIYGATESSNEIFCIISNLIFERYIKGYIYYDKEDKYLVFKKNSDPFPKLNEMKKL